MTLKAQPINCTLKPSGGEPSSTDAMIQVIAAELRANRVEVAPTRGSPSSSLRCDADR
jgi:hypothetical protein